MSKDSTEIILDALRQVESNVKGNQDRIEKKLDAQSVQVTDNIAHIARLEQAYTAIAPMMETIKSLQDQVNAIDKRQDSFGTSLKVGGTILTVLSGVLFYGAHSYIEKTATDTANTTTHQILDQQAILNDNKVTLTETKNKSKK
jgi:hypothetical protein